ncbi:class I adenylate-forming enzyme family protein [Desulfatirhabdium butyrativorans]|uniref:class I adenylate-forming enzyme family protein n=1 Tax=Desulfatirhabdium butyrativorans TaxID=340467 RepID=UPI0003F8105C|nr:class I adenylate-forming enzyme family protein [Desulfatirhabdium butyrativorans]
MKTDEPKTLLMMLSERAKEHPERIAILYQNQAISYDTLNREVNALANYLIRMGLVRGDTVGLMMNKTPEFVISFLGVANAGGMSLPIDFNQPLPRLQYLIDLTLPRVIIVSGEHSHVMPLLRLPPDYLCTIVVGERNLKTDHEWQEVIRGSDSHPPGISDDLNEPAYLNLTSGTTGVPKCAVTTHANIFWNTAAAVHTLHLTPDDIHLCLFAVFAHPHEIVARPLYLGGTMVLLDKITPKGISRAIQEHHVTCMMAIPSIYQTLVRLHESTGFAIPSLRLPESGGMHTHPVLLEEFENRFHRRIVPVWGSTEATGIALALALEGPCKPGSVGKPCETYQARIVDEHGIDVGVGDVGELIIRGPGVIDSYFQNTEETNKSMKNGWFFTGDLFRNDPDGFFFFVGRREGMMKVAGMKVYPIEIEEILLAHPGVSEAVVLKQHDELHGEVPRAIVVLKPDVRLDKGDLRRYCEQRLARCKVPRMIEFRTELPKTSGGKIRVKEL